MQVLIDKLKEPQYQGISDQAAADLINALTVQEVQLVPRKEILKIATIEGFYGHVIIDSENATLPIDHRVALINIKGWIDNAANDSEYADLASPTSAKMIADLMLYKRQGIATNLPYITPAIAQKINELKFKTVRWVDSIGFGTVGDGHVRSFRSMNNGIA
jgi:hypothetical protein